MKRKNLIILAAMAVMAAILVGCSSSSSVSDPSDSEPASIIETEDENSSGTSSTSGEQSVNRVSDADSQDSDSNTQEEDSAKYETVNFGDTITTDFLEMTIESASIVEELLPTDTSGAYSYQPDQDGEKYFYLTGTMKNVGGNSYDVENTYVEMVFDEKYTYSGYVMADDGGNSFYGSTVKPFGSVKYYIVSSIPDELLAQYTSCEIKFGFAENFDTYQVKYGGKYVDDCDYLYKIFVSK